MSPLILVLFLTAPPASEAPPLSLDVTPAVVMSPGTVRVTATVERHPENRRLVFTADSADFYRKSATSLNGDRAPRTHRLLLTALPAGRYVVEVVLERSDGSEVMQRLDLRVVGQEREPRPRSSGPGASPFSPRD